MSYDRNMKCVNCGVGLHGSCGESSIYGATEDDVLCETCFFSEEIIIDGEGTNDPGVVPRLAELLNHYHGK